MTAPNRSIEQRRAALAEANRIRVNRAQIRRTMKRAGKDGRRLLEAILCLDILGVAGRVPGLTMEDHDLDSAKVFDVLLWAPGIGRVKANRILDKARISPSKTVGGMSSRQRAELLELVPRLAPNTNENGGRTR